ncbi:unnamed protein product, partial [Rotaria magnacalcarata]
LVFFICTVSSKPISSSSDEDNNEIQQDQNRRGFDEILRSDLRTNAVDDDDEKSESQPVEVESESNGDDDDDDDDKPMEDVQ